MEAQFLSVLSHPNIIKIRGWASAGTDDCLNETLSTRIQKWAKEDAKYKNTLLGSVFRASSKTCSERERLLEDRLKVAYDITGAMKYLHKQNIIYRDLKPDNLGFDVRGDIKLFDFGLAREVPSEMDMNENVNEMSGAGSLRYMAPEVVM
eukprot:13846401-Ditylum_brightwellii.AAC.1